MTGEWTNIDKTGWGPGPWQDEPDKIHWVDPATDMDCLMVRQPRAGHWCGYVAVTEDHPFYGVDYDGCRLPNDEWIDIHGGLTFSDFCSESDDPATGICHVPESGRPHKVWWLGFDCAHLDDLSPGYRALELQRGWSAIGDDQYRDRAYVEDEVRSLARQLKAAA